MTQNEGLATFSLSVKPGLKLKLVRGNPECKGSYSEAKLTFSQTCLCH